MNVFPLDDNFTKSASYHVDSHIIKIPLECAQMLSTACRLNGYSDVGYKPTHVNHPMTKWVMECLENWRWMVEYASALNSEYRFRYMKDVDHKAFTVIKSLPEPNIPSFGTQTQMPLCMPDHCKILGDVISSYRKYYINEKSHLWKWKNREIPYWISEII